MDELATDARQAGDTSIEMVAMSSIVKARTTERFATHSNKLCRMSSTPSLDYHVT